MISGHSGLHLECQRPGKGELIQVVGATALIQFVGGWGLEYVASGCGGVGVSALAHTLGP